MTSGFDWLWWLSLFILIGIFIAAIYLVYWLGQLPGETARGRGHPQAEAISICGWLGLLFPPAWVVAIVWAYAVPAGRELQPPPHLEGIHKALGAASARVARIEQALAKRPS